MSSHTWRMQWANCWRTEKILVSMALPGSSLNSKYISMLPVGPAWEGLLETEHMENGSGHVLVMLWVLDFTGLAKGSLSVFWKCTWVCTVQYFFYYKHSCEAVTLGNCDFKNMENQLCCLSWSGLLVSNCLRNTEANCFTDCFWFQQHSFFLFLSMNLNC